MRACFGKVAAAAAAFMTLMMSCGAAGAFAVDISAKACIVIDADTGNVLYGKNESEKLAMASTTKIMSALIALEQEGIDEEFTVDSEAIKVEGSSMGLVGGARVSLRELCYGMLLPSGNDAANAAAVRISGSVESFVRLMNEEADALGMKDTSFVTPSGLDDDTEGHYSTAYDMAILMKKALGNADFRGIIGTESYTADFGEGRKNTIYNSNKLLGSVIGIIGGKTGFTDKAGRCLVTACERSGATLICVTLNDKNDWADHTALYNECFKSYELKELAPECDSFKLPVVGSEVKYIEAAAESISRAVFVGEESDITQTVIIKPFYYAPIKKGDVLGEVRFYQNGQLLAATDIVAVETAQVKKASEGLLYRLESFFKSLF